MSKFVLTAQLQLQAPTNVRQVVNQIQSQLNNVNVNVQLQNATKTQTQLNSLSKSADQTGTAFNRMGKNFGNAVRRFSALAIATRAVSLFTNTLSKAIQESIDFERELVKVAQVTGNTLSQLKFLSNTITDLSTSLGVGSTSLLNVSRILSQAGLSAQETQVALSTLAKTELAPTFDDITQTAEGAVAIFNQFGQGAAALESQLGSINAVAGKFAVEAGDLISTIRRTGGVFKASGGDLNELIALFTSVRATTRESAESIATGLRTIFTRIQRPKTIEFLRQYGVELTDLEGKFVGPYEAVRRLSQAFAGLEQGDLTFVQIAEELGGFRQIGKVIPLLQQFSVAQEALNVAQRGSGSLAADAASAQVALAVKINKVKEEFLSLVRAVTETSTFKVMANTALTLASSFIKVADSLKFLLPLITTLATVKLAKGIGGFLGGLSGKGFNQGGKVHAFARGGIVPGSGNSDTVPAMLTPGEFVIKKSSVNSIGAANLHAMNNNRYAKGGIVVNPGAIGGFFLTPEQGDPRKFSFTDREVQITNKSALSQLGYADATKGLSDEAYFFKSDAKQKAKILGRGSKVNKFLQDMPDNPTQAKIYIARAQKGDTNQQKAAANFNEDFTKSRQNLKQQRTQTGPKNIPLSGGITGYFPGRNDLENSSVAQEVRRLTKDAMYNTVLSSAKSIANGLDGAVPKIALNKSFLQDGASRSSSDPQALRTVEGYIFEGIINSLTGAKLSGGTTAFDFPSSSIAASKSGLKQLFTSSSGEGIDQLLKADAKRSASTDAFNSIVNKIVQDLNKGDFGGVSFKKFASGGAASGTDTVPAMLTPGEFVVNRASAQRIGYGNLNRMNKVGKYAQGGVVRGGVQYLANGGTAGGSGIFSGATARVGAFISSIGSATKSLLTFGKQSTQSANQATNAFANMGGTMGKAAQATAQAQSKASESSRDMGTGLILAAGVLQTFAPTVDESSSTLTRFTAKSIEGVASMAALIGVMQQLKQQFPNIGQSLQGVLSKIPGGIGKAIEGIDPEQFSKGMEAGAIATAAVVTAFNALTQTIIENARAQKQAAIVAGDIEQAGASAATEAGMGVRATFGTIGAVVGGTVGAVAGTLIGAAAGGVGAVPGGAVGGAAGAAAGGGVGILVADLAGFTEEAQRVAVANARIAASAVVLDKALKNAADKTADALKQVESGALTADQALRQLGAADAFAALIKQQEEVRAANASDRATAQKTAESYMPRFTSRTGAVEKSYNDIAVRNEKLASEVQKTTKAFEPFTSKIMKASAGAGQSFDQFFANLEAEQPEMGEFYRNNQVALDQLKNSYNNANKEVKRNIELLSSFNLGLNSASAAAVGLESRLTQAQSLNSGVSATDDLSTLRQSTGRGGGGVSRSMQREAARNTSAMMRSFGASEKEINKFNRSVAVAYEAQKRAPAILQEYQQKLQNRLSRGLAVSGDAVKPEAFIDQIVNSLGLKGKEAELFKDRIDLSKIKPEELMAGKFDSIFDALGEGADKLYEQVDPIAKAQEAYEKQVIAAADSLDAALDSRLNAFKAQIDLQIESAQLISKFGGQRFTPRDQFTAESRKLDLGLQRTGLGPTGGDPQAISRAFQEINRELQQLGQIDRTQLSTAESADVDARIKELNTANERLLNDTRSLIKVKQEELRVIQEKNRLEKSSLEALLAGDEEKFAEGMQTQGAISAIRSGQTQGISADVLNRAFQELKRQFEAGAASREDVQRAAMATAQARGFGPREAAEIAARVTGGGEERGVEGEIRSLAGTLPLAGDTMQTAADIQLQAADRFYAAVEQSKPSAVRESRRLSSGGMVYAAAGKYINFTPRGTDTIPAMLTPGEFVVNAGAVKRGNNLAVLQAMNKGQSPSAGSGVQNFARGGVVRYRANGSNGPEAGGGVAVGTPALDSSVVDKFASAVDKFNESVLASIEQLSNTSISLRLEPTNININLTGTEALRSITASVKQELLNVVQAKLSNLRVDNGGNIVDSAGSII